MNRELQGQIQGIIPIIQVFRIHLPMDQEVQIMEIPVRTIITMMDRLEDPAKSAGQEAQMILEAQAGQEV